ncbi:MULTISPECIES: hydroxysqualene dehydroxylase [Streptomyces]|uniref:hydroxysqualene dehydroxylase n=1 Tax=Streptomyces TaxID=1883 RepID=UPI00163C8A1B|nr:MULTISPECIES: FAD-dependent oxidoreductase [Streptomyces]MBC2878555.1 FAD-dependent oxidoreductase [Streptomyces sp. TYQ1024]UBI35214.1 FAD-dependent oxidoreductase [Streptomyces mobaraensis]UKW27806.1 FAD-dependent oxidoreductase [Streptomyces sp. TYQ1024]
MPELPAAARPSAVPRRRALLLGAAAGAAPGLAPGTARSASRRAARSVDGRRVAVIGAGVGGLTVAHELAERGFAVAVYERRAVPGGKARSLYVPHTGTGGRRDLPGEHGHRGVFGFYHNLPDTLRRIPLPGGQSVHSRLTPVRWVELARVTGRPDLPVPVDRWVPSSLSDVNLLISSLAGLLQEGVRLPPWEALFFAKQAVMLLTSCTERRFGQWEYVRWWDFIRADGMSEDYQKFLGGGVQLLQALRAPVASTRTCGQGMESILYDLAGRGSDTGGPFDRVFDAPTSEAWLDPWAAHLRALGVRFAFGRSVERLDLRGGRIASATARTVYGTTERIDADWFVVALPADRAVRLWNPALRSADPRLAAMDGLRHTWCSGIQYYLREQAPGIRGHVVHVDSPWKLASIAQSRVWSAPFARTWGDGRVRESLSVVISEWETPGILYGKPARRCTRAEVAREVWAQMKAHLADHAPLDDALLETWYLDEAITEDGSGGLRDDDPFLMNTAGSWDLRPEATTAVPNLFLAADHVRTYSNIDFASMETANEAGRRAAGAILAAAGGTGGGGGAEVRTFRGYEAPEFAAARALDRQRWRQGLRHVLDIG